MMKKLLITTAAIAGLAMPSFAAELEPNENSKSQGSNVGQASSAVTGNGAVIGGGRDGGGQTSEPGSRAEEVQGLQAAEGRGRSNSNNPENQ